MESVDRSAITNSIWLCGNCHKLIDDDPASYPSGLLFEWQRTHELRIGEIVGKAGAEIRRRYEDRHLEGFGRVSYLSERIILEKPQYWEYRLTAEALRFELASVLRRWRALQQKLYMKPLQTIEKLQTTAWILARNEEIVHITDAFAGLMNNEFKRAWGEQGVAGNDLEIVEACRLFAEVCGSALAWEESVRFVMVDKIFEEVRDLYIGIAGAMIDEAVRVPEFLTSSLDSNSEPGTYTLNIVLSLPDGWTDSVNAACKRATDAFIAELES